MTLFLWECLFCLLPSLLLLGLLVFGRRSSVSAWTGRTLEAVGWTLWRGFCLILHLPLDKASPVSVCTKTQFMCKPSTLAQYLLRHCTVLSRTTLASWPKGDPHLQTVQALLCGAHALGLQFTRDHLLLKDGGIVALDWAIGSGVSDSGVRRSPSPVLLLLPEHWGGLSPHLKSLCLSATAQGFYVVVFHHRGTAGCPLTTTRLSEFGDPADLEQAVAYIHSRYPSSVLLAVSEGSGSGTLLSYLGERGSSSRLTAAAAISPVLLGQVWFETAFPPLYHWGMLYHRKQQLRRYASSFRRILDVDHVLKSSSLKEFEERLFCNHHQYEEPWGLAPSVAWELKDRAHPTEDWGSYWERNEPLRDADEVAIPVLCICSQDDPLLPPVCALPLSLFQNNPYFMLLITETGGHCGFTIQNSNNQPEDMNWSHIAVLDYFRAVVDFLKGGEKDVGFWIGPTGEQRNRTNTLASFRKRKFAGMKRPQNQNINQSLNEAGEFTWKRSYTR
ncbi:protein ABHD15 [Boleophthalmus pectinirostris]|uniref:protein ABHD15 n=1 Tax=Boleophthalmus pectinirostris TaxID=150288 RepID=UPI00242FDE2F|nr:protein ABHD15 [Boleophthalmus pectinirostris]